MALLALYMLNNTSSLADFLDGIFKSAKLTVIEPDPTDVKGFDDYIKVYKQVLDAERAAADVLRNNSAVKIIQLSIDICKTADRVIYSCRKDVHSRRSAI